MTEYIYIAGGIIVAYSVWLMAFQLYRNQKILQSFIREFANETKSHIKRLEINQKNTERQIEAVLNSNIELMKGIELEVPDQIDSILLESLIGSGKSAIDFLSEAQRILYWNKKRGEKESLNDIEGFLINF